MFMYLNHDRFSLPRCLAAIPSALIVTFLLVLLMQCLVYTKFDPPAEEPEIPIPQIVYERTPPQPIKEPIEKPVDVSEPPQQQAPSLPNEFTVEPLTMPTPHAPHTGKFKLIEATGSLPVASVLPTAKYPTRAITRGIEGWVDVRYDIDTTGATFNIKILDASPSGYFERAATNAVRRWKYQPFIDSKGEPVVYEGMIKRMVFELDN